VGRVLLLAGGGFSADMRRVEAEKKPDLRLSHGSQKRRRPLPQFQVPK